MSEKVKNRGWVKNVAIIFLAVMLVLTFFSNTIMNRSLPEVTGQSVQPGSITTQVRGDGRIEAAETYEVKSADSRKVQSVPVSVGQEVKVGDTLVVLAAGDSEELKNAQDALEAAQLAYQQALINFGANDSGDSTTVARAKEELRKAIAERDKLEPVSDEEIAITQGNVDYYNQALLEAQRELEDAGGSATADSALRELYQAREDARNARDTALIRYKYEYYFVMGLAQYAERNDSAHWYSDTVSYADAIADVFSAKGGYTGGLTPGGDEGDEGGDGEEGGSGSTSSSATSELYDYFNNATTDVAEKENLYIEDVRLWNSIYVDGESGNTVETVIKKLPSQTFRAVSTGYEAVAAAQRALTAAEEAIIDANPANGALQQEVTELTRARDDAQSLLDSLNEQKTAYDGAVTAVETAQRALEDAVKSQSLDNLDINQKAKAVADAQALVDELSAGKTNEDGTVTGGTITSEVNGIVKAINVTAGGSTDPANAIMTIEVPDRGYTVSITVTADQASKVTVGDTAEIQTGYWGGSDLHGRLLGIRNVPGSQGAQASRLLVFEVTGEGVESGTQVSVSIGQRSQSYDLIVPNSAVRSDSNGSFVLMMTAKSSPLGTRYQATRVDVQVVASDDVNSAVTGAIVAYDYVITNSTAPIEDGMYVRLADNA